MKRIYYNIMCAIGAICGFSSCGDFLEIEPQNEIIHENFWNEKADVDGIVSGCYSKLQSEGIIKRMMVWGEFRSDNVVAGQNISDDIHLDNVLKANIDASNVYTTWDEFYNVINRCNTVIQFAPQVAEKDLSFTESELRATIAEMTALRSLCYFYLIRTFRDVPYTATAFLSDDQVMDLPATKFDAVLDSLIQDLERVRPDAVKKYPETQPLYQTGRITQDAIHAMLCEMYLWKKDYQNCIRYADLVIDAKKKEKEENDKKANGASSAQNRGTGIDGFPLISSSYREGGNSFGQAYYYIFGQGNSSESIFELTFMDDDNMPSNGAVNAFYGNVEKPIGYAAPSPSVGQDVSNKIYAIFNNQFDVRYYENIASEGSSTFRIQKMTGRMADVTISGSTGSEVSMMVSIYGKDKNKSNWMFYRLTDIMLLKAEAITQTMLTGDDEATIEANNAKLREAFTLVNAVNKRSVGQPTLKDTLVYSNFSSKTQMTDLVYQERQRELMFEGKRWFDLVRRSMREGNTDYLTRETIKKHSSNSSVVQNKLAKMDAIFWPYNIDELKVNKNLIQNPAFGSGEDDSYTNTAK
ncbi:MAG: RagB/SusD family nutrient uptake outer membrane protein [Prevotella sp.]|nr:RagB/SusD family nutrient uptake outer membrane protein [Prevotella sp.]